MYLSDKTKLDKAIRIIALVVFLLKIADSLFLLFTQNVTQEYIFNHLIPLLFVMPVIVPLIYNRYLQSVKVFLIEIPIKSLVAVIHLSLVKSEYNDLTAIISTFFLFLFIAVLFAIPEIVLFTYLKMQNARKLKRTILIVLFSISIIMAIVNAVPPKFSISAIADILKQSCYLLLALKPLLVTGAIPLSQTTSESK